MLRFKEKGLFSQAKSWGKSTTEVKSAFNRKGTKVNTNKHWNEKQNVGRFANVQVANVLRRFANVFSPILMAHCRDSKLHFFNWQQFICFPKCYHIWFAKFIYEVKKYEVWKFRSVAHDYRALLKKIRAGRMQIEESKYKCEIRKLPFSINNNISFTKLTSLLLHLEI